MTLRAAKTALSLVIWRNYIVTNVETYTVQDIQKIFKCGKRQAYELMRAPAFPSIKLGGKYIVEKRALERWFSDYEGKNFMI